MTEIPEASIQVLPASEPLPPTQLEPHALPWYMQKLLHFGFKNKTWLHVRCIAQAPTEPWGPQKEFSLLSAKLCSFWLVCGYHLWYLPPWVIPGSFSNSTKYQRPETWPWGQTTSWIAFWNICWPKHPCLAYPWLPWVLESGSSNQDLLLIDFPQFSSCKVGLLSRNSCCPLRE